MRSTMIRFLALCVVLLPALSGCGKKLLAPTPLDSGYVNAVEVKLKCRELADQLLGTMPNDAIQGFVAMPTSFVDQNNTSRSSPLGRLMGESLFYEFNQRGFPTLEYRLTGKISVTGGRDDLALASNQVVCAKGQKWGALLVGTYYVDEDATFVNARLVRASDGLVLRTGQLVLVNTPIVKRMGKSDSVSAAPSPANAVSRPVAAHSPSAGSYYGSALGYPPLYSPAVPAATVSRGGVPIKQGR